MFKCPNSKCPNSKCPNSKCPNRFRTKRRRCRSNMKKSLFSDDDSSLLNISVLCNLFRNHSSTISCHTILFSTLIFFHTLLLYYISSKVIPSLHIFEAITTPSDQTSHTYGCILHTILSHLDMLFQSQISYSLYKPCSATIPLFFSPLSPKGNSIQIFNSLIHSVPFLMIVSWYLLVMTYSSQHTRPIVIC